MKRVLLPAIMLALIAIPGVAQDSSRTSLIEQAVEQMSAGLGHKVQMQPGIDKVASFGDEAVPLLVRRYETTDDGKCWPIVFCLCQISTDDSLRFVQQMLNEHKKKWATSAAIKNYPIVLIGLVQLQEHRYDAIERLKKMIDKKPSRAGQIVDALKDDKNLEAYEYELGEILAYVSGYSYTWCVWIPPGKDRVAFRNNFWREWWSRNKDKDVFGWLQETVTSDNENRVTAALQRLYAIRDKRAVPYFLKSLDSPSDSVQYWAVVGLKNLDGTLPEAGYLSEAFHNEKDKIIPLLKQKFQKSESNQPTGRPAVSAANSSQ